MGDEPDQEVSNIIEKMLQETAERIRQDKTNQGPPMNLAAASLAPVYNYCHAVLLLARNGQALPAMALLRVLGEFTIRLMWCYESEDPGENVSTRLERWYKYSLNERKRAMQKWLPFLKESDPEFARESEAIVDEAETTMDSMKCRSAPPLTECIEALGLRGKQLFPLLYTRYAHAVHIDAELLSQLHRSPDSQICYSADGVEVLTPADLECAALLGTFTIIITICNHFGWDWGQYQAAIDAIVERACSQKDTPNSDPSGVVWEDELTKTKNEMRSDKREAAESSCEPEPVDELTAEMARVLGKMVESTVDKIVQDKKKWAPPKNLAAATLDPVYSYCYSVLLLAENKYELPAMALLRVLGEFAIRLVWCYESSENEGDATTRIERWYKYSLNERSKAMEKWLPFLKQTHPELASEAETRIMDAREVMGIIPQGMAPSLAKCLDTLHPAARLLVLLQYTRYIHSIHIDPVLLDRLTRSSGSGIIYTADTEELTPLDLKYRSLAIAFNIISTIWDYFGWDWREHMVSVNAIVQKCNLPQEIDFGASCRRLFRTRGTE
jgi:hypothetical protein